MKNIQIIDSGDNCTFSIFEATDEEFRSVFPEDGQDIQFSEDLDDTVYRVLDAVWERPIRKTEAQGIHGTLFYGFEQKRSWFPATKREKDWDRLYINAAQRRLYGSD